MFLRMRVNRWSEYELASGQLTIPIKPGKSIGYMEVFETLDAMKKQYPKEKDFIEVVEEE
jgi:hypothetical protein